jgi:tRNA(Ile)-lysidine synthetase-like protein
MNQKLAKKDKIFIDKIDSKIGRAINYYNLINADDKVLVAVSGGKDSLVLLDSLWRRLKNIPVSYSLFAVHVSLENLSYKIDENLIYKFCEDRGIEFEIHKEKVDLNFSDKTPCFICSHTRRKLLFELAAKKGCNKLAFGHHMDDAVETLLMNMMYQSSISSIPAKISMFDGKFDLIRPLIKVRDSETKKYSDIFNYPKMKSLCSFEDKTKRNKANEILELMENNYKNSVSSIFASMQNVDKEYLP